MMYVIHAQYTQYLVNKTKIEFSQTILYYIFIDFTTINIVLTIFIFFKI